MKILDLQRLTDDVLMKHGNIEVKLFLRCSSYGGVEAIVAEHRSGNSLWLRSDSMDAGCRAGELLTESVAKQKATSEAEERFHHTMGLFEEGKLFNRMQLTKGPEREADFQRACDEAESPADLAAEYRRFWDEAALQYWQRATPPLDDSVKDAAHYADLLTEQRCNRFGTEDAPQAFKRFCSCGNRLVCDQCHCSPEHCKCKDGYTGI